MDGASAQVAPQMATCSDNIDPTSPIALTGQNFGPATAPGMVHIHFSKPSPVAFENSCLANLTNRGCTKSSKSDLYLNAPQGQWGDTTIKSEPLDSASPIGAPAEQPVTITVIAANGTSSANTCQATFHPRPVITGMTSGSITFGQSFNIWGWDFGDGPGTVNIRFSNNDYNSGALNNKNDLNAQFVVINKDTNNKYEWQGWKVSATVNPAGVVEQDVDITLTTNGGSVSNAWKEKFKPLMVMAQLSTVVALCTQSTSIDLCNPGPGSYGGGATCGLDTIGQPLTTADSIEGFHYSCAIAGSDNGLDVYTATVTAPWTITQVVNETNPPLPPGVWGTIGQGATYQQDVTIEFDYHPQPLPLSGTVAVGVYWIIGPEGSLLFYDYNVIGVGPAGIPAQ